MSSVCTWALLLPWVPQSNNNIKTLFNFWILLYPECWPWIQPLVLLTRTVIRSNPVSLVYTFAITCIDIQFSSLGAILSSTVCKARNNFLSRPKALCRRTSETALRAASLHAESGLACQMLLHTVACNYAWRVASSNDLYYSELLGNQGFNLLRVKCNEENWPIRWKSRIKRFTHWDCY